MSIKAKELGTLAERALVVAKTLGMDTHTLGERTVTFRAEGLGEMIMEHSLSMNVAGVGSDTPTTTYDRRVSLSEVEKTGGGDSVTFCSATPSGDFCEVNVQGGKFPRVSNGQLDRAVTTIITVVVGNPSALQLREAHVFFRNVDFSLTVGDGPSYEVSACPSLEGRQGETLLEGIDNLLAMADIVARVRQQATPTVVH